MKQKLKVTFQSSIYFKLLRKDDKIYNILKINTKTLFISSLQHFFTHHLPFI